ncbi:hypothetical protein OGAPHI_001676 [Ogataea philodendri]|uniref:BZIP domain-containing protein n=1 Tax=Ogataea philodendri TaxID=1378263 RepID=A0A9P8T8D0_9ASCO|nr:uncharacterized protein OGAPHI_001676 [Ogataea philodendri]KAH3669080.1 hypothetical protein OGAPHI_001676 [Ogataea philodendri]
MYNRHYEPNGGREQPNFVKKESPWIPSVDVNEHEQQFNFALNLLNINQQNNHSKQAVEPLPQLTPPSDIPVSSRSSTEDSPLPDPSILKRPLSKPSPMARKSFQNFYLDPEDFQNLLLVNPPLLDYPYEYAPPPGNPYANPAHPQEPAPSHFTDGQNPVSAEFESVQTARQDRLYGEPEELPHPLPRRRVSISNGQIGQISMMFHKSDVKKESSVDEPDIQVNENGVPQQPLLYNNEVIFNPNAGPIHGTTAWKKQRILERNRIAASKCRQKKKVRQEKLQHDIDLLTSKNTALQKLNKHLESLLVELKQELHGCMVPDTVTRLLNRPSFYDGLELSDPVLDDEEKEEL